MDGRMENGRTEPAGCPQEAGGDKSAGGPPSQRFSAKRKLRLRGEPLELVARELSVTATPGRNGGIGLCWPRRQR
jgi:hypothetical protein